MLFGVTAVILSIKLTLASPTPENGGLEETCLSRSAEEMNEVFLTRSSGSLILFCCRFLSAILREARKPTLLAAGVRHEVIHLT
jgi:hypothetical protein